MTVVLPKHKLVYIEAPRTASRTTHRWLLDRYEGVELSSKRHLGALPARQLLAQDDSFGSVADYRFFGFTRNPYSGMVSAWLQTKCQPNIAEEWRWLQELAQATPDFPAYLKAAHETAGDAWLGAAKWVYRLRTCHDVLRFEDGFPEVLIAYLRYQGLCLHSDDILAIPHVGKSNKNPDWRSYYNDEARELVGRVFRRYLRKYDYAFALP